MALCGWKMRSLNTSEEGAARVRGRRFRGLVSLASCLALLGGLVMPGVSHAATADQIDTGADQALAVFEAQYPGAREFLDRAAGVAVFPGVVKAAFVFGAQYGEGVLRVRGSDCGYYSFSGASWGASIGVQSKDIILVFRDDAALQQFESASGWQAGMDSSITIVAVGAGTNLSTLQINQPVVGFVVDQKGLMADVSLTGSKISAIER